MHLFKVISEKITQYIHILWRKVKNWEKKPLLENSRFLEKLFILFVDQSFFLIFTLFWFLCSLINFMYDIFNKLSKIEQAHCLTKWNLHITDISSNKEKNIKIVEWKDELIKWNKYLNDSEFKDYKDYNFWSSFHDFLTINFKPMILIFLVLLVFLIIGATSRPIWVKEGKVPKLKFWEEPFCIKNFIEFISYKNYEFILFLIFIIFYNYFHLSSNILDIISQISNADFENSIKNLIKIYSNEEIQLKKKLQLDNFEKLVDFSMITFCVFFAPKSTTAVYVLSWLIFCAFR